MPLYSFECTKCGHRFDTLRPMRDMKVPETEPCPECGEIGNVEQRVFSAQMWIDSNKLGIKQPDNGWREVLSKVAEKTAGSNLRDKLSRNP